MIINTDTNTKRTATGKWLSAILYFVIRDVEDAVPYSQISVTYFLSFLCYQSFPNCCHHSEQAQL